MLKCKLMIRDGDGWRYVAEDWAELLSSAPPRKYRLRNRSEVQPGLWAVAARGLCDVVQSVKRDGGRMVLTTVSAALSKLDAPQAAETDETAVEANVASDSPDEQPEEGLSDETPPKKAEKKQKKTKPSKKAKVADLY